MVNLWGGPLTSGEFQLPLKELWGTTSGEPLDCSGNLQSRMWWQSEEDMPEASRLSHKTIFFWCWWGTSLGLSSVSFGSRLCYTLADSTMASPDLSVPVASVQVLTSFLLPAPTTLQHGP